MTTLLIPEEDTVEYQWYTTEDKKYSAMERDDGFFLLWVYNTISEVYEWIESYLHSLKECEDYIIKLEGDDYNGRPHKLSNQ